MAAQSVDDLWGYLHGYLHAQALMTGCKLRIFDELKNEPKTASDICIILGAELDAVERLLNALVSLGALSRVSPDDFGSNDDKFINSDLSSRYLTTESPMTLRPCILVADKYLYGLAGNLSFGVRDGNPQAERAFGISSRKFYKDSAKSDDEKLLLLASMHSKATVFYRDAATKSFDLSQYKHACNIGGGTGAVAFALAAVYQHMKVTVLDVPSVVEVASKFTPADPYSHNVTFKGGNIFKGSFPDVDLFVLTDIVHKWPEQRIKQLLCRLFDSLSAGGAVLILDCFHEDDKRGSLAASMMGLLMLLTSTERCFQRSFADMCDLLRKIGFVEVKVKKNGDIVQSMIATKPPIDNGELDVHL
ncbi:acetylserotonin O-methyltransferase-like [Saccoglossus kowalevskii]|uniref:Acetylserotonin O-methyltransferase n=1 Tax=Saccoglossus kowalevskii TaxID=10224 RepID=A0ABM0GW25_SACKO|nr:PREDICTED: N-acetylserotonin O-methyltransferase-like protein-like [Saccoglossus kowalevskii]